MQDVAGNKRLTKFHSVFYQNMSCPLHSFNISFLHSSFFSFFFLGFVVTIGLPSSVRNCSYSNQTHHSVEIQCIPGYDGGLPQFFVLELISTRTGRVRWVQNCPNIFFVIRGHRFTRAVLITQHIYNIWRARSDFICPFQTLQLNPCHFFFVIRFNVTNMEEPSFLVESLDTLHFNEDHAYKVVIYSVNQKGRSSKVALKDLFIGERSNNVPRK